MERDLLGVGLRLRWLEDGTDRLTWADVVAMTREALPGSAVLRWVDPWDIDTHLLAGVLDALNGANWQRGGGKGAAPKPVPRPEDMRRTQAEVVDETPDDDHIPTVDESGTYKGMATPVNELADWLGWTATTDEQIVTAYENGEGTYRALGERFGVSASTVGRLVRAART